MCEININGVNITLTKEQLAQIDKQRNKEITIDNINSIEDAEKVLEGQSFHIKYTKKQFCRHKDWVNYQLETLAKAINFLDNEKKEYILTKNSYYPYFTHDETQGGWVFYISGNYCYCYSYAAAAYFKTKKEAINFGKKFIHLYKEILPKF